MPVVTLCHETAKEREIDAEACQPQHTVLARLNLGPEIAGGTEFSEVGGWNAGSQAEEKADRRSRTSTEPGFLRGR
jgi:hypothetical protein